MRLPNGYNGWDIAKTVRGSAFKDTPIIALSAPVTTSDPLMAREAGCDEYIAKPYSLYTLHDAISHYVA
jgi:DNA-binding response OmpR family regulator